METKERSARMAMSSTKATTGRLAEQSAPAPEPRKPGDADDVKPTEPEVPRVPWSMKELDATFYDDPHGNTTITATVTVEATIKRDSAERTYLRTGSGELVDEILAEFEASESMTALQGVLQRIDQLKARRSDAERERATLEASSAREMNAGRFEEAERRDADAASLRRELDDIDHYLTRLLRVAREKHARAAVAFEEHLRLRCSEAARKVRASFASASDQLCEGLTPHLEAALHLKHAMDVSKATYQKRPGEVLPAVPDLGAITTSA